MPGDASPRDRLEPENEDKNGGWTTNLKPRSKNAVATTGKNVVEYGLPAKERTGNICKR
jgi:hypothetical protein